MVEADIFKIYKNTDLLVGTSFAWDFSELNTS